jgi:hypothetical protein
MKIDETTDFRIIEETDISYSTHDKLYLSLIQINGHWGVEVSNRTQLEGRLITESRRQAERLFTQTRERLNDFNDYYSASSLIDLAYAMKSENECRFLLNILHEPWTYQAIKAMGKTYGVITSAKQMEITFEGNEPVFTIRVMIRGQKEDFGLFTSSGSDAPFFFGFNQDYLLR